MLTFGELFAGISGFGLGFERAGMVCKWQVEKDRDCQRVLAARYPNTEKYLDVTECANLEPVDVICGGFPCQDLSVAGKRAGMGQGTRSGLFYEMVRIVNESRPSLLVWENVPGLLSSDNGRDFARVIRALDDIGYSGAWTSLDAQWFGVAQRRRRVFGVFAQRDIGAGRCAEILSLTARMCGDLTPSREARSGVAPTVRGGTASGSNESGNKIAATLDQRGRGPTDSVMMNLQVARALAAEPGQRNDGTAQNYVVTHALSSEGADASEDGTGRGTPIVVAATLNSGGNSGGFRTEPGEHLVAFTSKDSGQDAGDISPTLRSMNFKDSHLNGGGQVATAGAFGVRRLTPRECERLQGFPDDWTATDSDGKEISDSARYRMLGNAVAVPCAEWIGRRIIGSLNGAERT